ncbi:MAG TPA: DNA/RNA nuclease SfsA [Thermodesulfobacteriaceae bacterium]|nr:DNA/RNA nuclease SfsA [Thermodesulfobacteriaceae bacterium]
MFCLAGGFAVNDSRGKAVVDEPVRLVKVVWDTEAVFVERPNRFLGLADCNMPGSQVPEKIHISDPGRLRELLYPGNRVLLRKAPAGTARKTCWDLIAAAFGEQWVVVNSSLHRGIAQRILEKVNLSPFGRAEEIRPEIRFGESRLDFMLLLRDGRRVWIEVKGCTLARDGSALFPDAPTARGRRHLEELITIRSRGLRSALLILIFRDDAQCFAPNGETDPAFHEVFYRAIQAGVEVYPVVIGLEQEWLVYRGVIPVCREERAGGKRV